VTASVRSAGGGSSAGAFCVRETTASRT
jgi:hypothetical protein